jgi:eukaryotic-like serine/threonine-protein kinase
LSFPLHEHLTAALGASYTIERELGGGGMSRVFVAEEKALGRRVVIKVLPPEMAAALSSDRFRQEIQLAARVQHPHIVPLLSAGEIANGWGTGAPMTYFTMPYVEGESLRSRLAGDAMTISDLIRILREVASALEAAHAKGIVHRDVKPENVLLSHGSAMVTDFGVARAISSATVSNERLTTHGLAIGTPAYMAPEQAAADPTVDHRADIYSWGVLAYELLTGATPFAGRPPQAMLAAHTLETPQPLPSRHVNVPPALASLVMRCLAKLPADRPQSAAAIVRELDDITTTPSGTARLEGVRVKGAQRRTIASAAAIIVVFGLAAMFVSQRSKQQRAAAVVATSDSSQGAVPPRNAIAVLPFTNSGGPAADEYLSDGMTDELTTSLAKRSDLEIVGRRSAYAFKGKDARPQDIGHALGAAFLLDGTVRRVGSRMRVSAQLTRAANGIVVWSDRYEGPADDVFALQDSIADAIAGALRLRLASSQAGGTDGTRTASPEAHDLYLQARFNAAKHTREGLLKAIALFQQSIAKDSLYALPWAGIGDAYGWLADDYVPTSEAYPIAKQAAQRSLQLAPRLAEGHAVLGWILYAYDWDFAGSERESAAAIALDPGSALARSNHAFALHALGRFPESIAEMRRAIALDPLSASQSANLEWALLMARRYDEVIAQRNITRELDPTYFFSDSWGAVAYRALGRFDEALAIYLEQKRREPSRPLAGLAVTYVAKGDTAAARAELRALEEYATRSYVRPEQIAQVYVALGQPERALELLERAVATRSNGTLTLRDASSWEPLRADPRFARLVARTGLAPLPSQR